MTSQEFKKLLDTAEKSPEQVARAVMGLPAKVLQYKPSPDGGYEPWSVIVPEVSDGRIVELTFFLDTKALFPLFGLPDRLA